MAFQRATGSMPVHVTVHRGLAKQLAHLHATAVHTLRDPSARADSLSLYIFTAERVSAHTLKSVIVSIELLDPSKIDKYFLKIRKKKVLHV